MDKCSVDIQIVVRHQLGAETANEMLTDFRVRERFELRQGVDCASNIVDDIVRYPPLDHLWYRAPIERDNGSATGQCLDRHQAKRLRPVDRKQECLRTRQERGLLPFADLTDEIDMLLRQQGFDDIRECMPGPPSRRFSASDRRVKPVKRSQWLDRHAFLDRYDRRKRDIPVAPSAAVSAGLAGHDRPCRASWPL